MRVILTLIAAGFLITFTGMPASHWYTDPTSVLLVVHTILVGCSGIAFGMGWGSAGFMFFIPAAILSTYLSFHFIGLIMVGIMFLISGLPLSFHLGIGIYYMLALMILCTQVFIVATLTFAIKVMIKGEPDMPATAVESGRDHEPRPTAPVRL